MSVSARATLPSHLVFGRASPRRRSLSPSGPDRYDKLRCWSSTQFALLTDGTTYAERGDARYAAELAALRTGVELDRLGIVAHVLGKQGCMPMRAARIK